MKKLWAIGDVHGRADMLRPLLERINAERGPEDVLVFLGDYIDRGPDSRGVIELVIAELYARPDHTVALWGNHEDMAAASYDMRSPCALNPNMAGRTWMGNGGHATLESYAGGSDSFYRHLGDFVHHLRVWMRPYGFEAVAPEVVCVHAGVPGGEDAEALAQIDPEPGLASLKGPAALLWMRPQPSDRKDPARLVICGHTPRINEVVNEKYFICIDTGAAYGGCLTALELGADGSRAFWHVSPELRITKRDGTLGGTL